MIIFPPCKINLGLQVLSKRPDGYHDLESVFYPLPLCDALEFQPAPVTKLFLSGIPLQGNKEDNLCLKAYHLLLTDYPELPPVSIYLHKHIPSGAGLGGGSSDGAQLLLAMNNYFSLELSDAVLKQYALRLGSDCPFFLSGEPALVKGRGNLIDPVSLDLSNYSFLLVHPPIHIPTAWAFTKVVPDKGRPSIPSVITRDISQWKNLLTNDFEPPAFDTYPFLASIKEQLYSAGALYASMSGSGSSFYGIFPKNQIPEISFGPAITTTMLK